MSDVLTCLACGHTGTDVSMTVVKYVDPQPVQIALPVAHDRRGRVAGNEIRDVMGVFGSEWRCTDHDACARRLEEQRLASRERAPW